jgi:hypothetical protein
MNECRAKMLWHIKNSFYFYNNERTYDGSTWYSRPRRMVTICYMQGQNCEAGGCIETRPVLWVSVVGPLGRPKKLGGAWALVHPRGGDQTTPMGHIPHVI